MSRQDEDALLLEDALIESESNLYTGDGSIDIKGQRVLKSSNGNWKACRFILGTECCERLAYFGIATNLISYLTKNLHQGNVSAATIVTTWTGTCYLAPLIGALLADAYWGRYWTIAVFSVIYFIGMCTLTLSASIPSLRPIECIGDICPSTTPIQYAFFFTGLYLIALGTGGIKPCVLPFGADQFDDTDPKERITKGSFFSWYLDKAAVVSFLEHENENYSNSWRLCTITQVEELKILIRMVPIWATGIVFSAVYAQISAVYAQMSTMFVEQGMTMDTTIGSFTLPAASLAAFDVISVIFWVPVYDRLIVPLARKFTGQGRGFSELQRMGIGLFLSMFCMVAAALVEIKRLEAVSVPVRVKISVFWQAPQYLFIGVAEVFFYIGQLEFFYDQSPDAMRSLCCALSLLTFGLGNYLSSFILTMVTYFTARDGKPGWIPDNLNEGHLDYFFLLLAGLSFLNMLVYIVCAKVYKSKTAI